MKLSTSILHSNQRHSVKCWLVVIILLKTCLCASAQDTVDLPLYEEWDTYSATSSRNVNGWLFCKTGIDDESIVQRNNLHAFLTTGSTAGSGTVVATPYLSQVPDTFSFRLYGSSLNGHMALVEFGFIPDSPPIGTASDICGLFVPYDTVSIYTSNQWFRTTVDLHPYFAIHGFAHRFAIRLINNYHQELYLDEIRAWIPADELSSCLDETTLGKNFWVAFTPNAIRLDNGQSNTGAVLSLIATGSQSASITVTNSETGWSQTFTHSGGDKTYMQLPSHWDNTSAAPTSMCYHAVSTQPISLFASNFFKDSWDVCNVMPERALGTNYIIQDLSLPDNPFSPCLAIAASQDNTTISCVLPTQVFGSSLNVGDTLTVTLQQGQSLMLRSSSATTFCGMPITADKPIAVFQGHSCALVGATGGRDLLLEQARPIETWGTQFVATSTLTRTEGDVVLVTSSADNCTVEINGSVVATLSARQTYSYTMPSSSQAAFITTSQPAYACLYPWSYNNGRTLGDPSSISLNPVDRWICEAWFPIHNCNTNPYDEQYIAANNHYLNIAVPSSATDSMFLDGTPITGFTPIGSTGYSFARQSIAVGAHHLRNPQGNFFASAYGLGKWVCYGFEIGAVIDSIPIPPPPEPQIHHDTITYSDSVCMGQPYLSPMEIVCGGTTYYPPSGLIYVRPAETAEAGILERWSNWVVGDTLVHHIRLTLTVLPTYDTTLLLFLILGDTLFFLGDTLTQAGTYLYTFTAANGCDSLLTLHVNWEEVGLTVSADGICLGDSVTLTATGALTAYWSATPPDPSLDSRQGLTVITVSPQQTTVYNLLSYEGGPLVASVTVHVEQSPELCFEMNRPFIDFDYPVMLFTDCSEGSHHTTWSFSDGTTLTSAKARRQFRHPLPDSVEVTLQSCSQWNCCADTTFVIKPCIRSVWFPNVFTPGEETNNRFGVIASFEIVAYELHIYNRMGLLVFYTDDPADLWDGTHEGLPLPQGTYAYHWHVRDAVEYNHTGTGTVTLLR